MYFHKREKAYLINYIIFQLLFLPSNVFLKFKSTKQFYIMIFIKKQ